MRAAEHRLASRLQSRPRLYRLARGTRTALGNVMPVRRIAGIGPVHPNDLMFVEGAPDAVEHYRSAGDQAFALCTAALRTAGRPDAPSMVLDLGCGHGRCLRVFRRCWPDARIVAADVDGAAVRFAAKTFDAEGVVLPADRPDVPRGPFDLVWVGSVFTHLPFDAAAALLEAIATELAPGGVVVLTTHDPDTVGELITAPTKSAAITGAIRRTGSAFDPYRDETTYGLAWYEPARFESLAEGKGLAVIRRTHRAWVGFQDAWALVRPDSRVS
jgi:SAM-dependent methyltransferase